jgi:gamma-glutamylcyclotransferase
MLVERLKRRCKSARVIGPAWAEGYVLAFSKQSKDGSGKATLVKTADPALRVHGVLFNLNESDGPTLDREEGSGYQRVDEFRIFTAPDIQSIAAITYIARADRTNLVLLPYDWYLKLAVAGAERAALPADYIDKLRNQKTAADPDPHRASQIEALELLKSVGYSL